MQKILKTLESKKLVKPVKSVQVCNVCVCENVVVVCDIEYFPIMHNNIAHNVLQYSIIYCNIQIISHSYVLHFFPLNIYTLGLVWPMGPNTRTSPQDCSLLYISLGPSYTVLFAAYVTVRPGHYKVLLK